MNKKMLLSILIIAFIGISAAGTWANFTKSADSTGNTLTAGNLNIALDRPSNQPFSVGPMIPDSKINDIVYHKCWWGTVSDKHYDIRVWNTGNIPASLFVSSTLTSDPASLAQHVKLYYSESDAEDAAKTEITSSLLDTGFNIPAGQSKQLYFWYSYENVPNQNAEMGKTANALITFELRNPDSPVPPSGI
ncbi:hypothetical protein DU69_17475 [Methanosarcina mazei]|uniref:Uncharacterized protein n=2 Tax=Methanosarcina mazei TaxID=2209 RepID=A0A0F8LKF5_METMZ|nr:hypothetical protein DU69_17475 [Methanosarcina mazei]